MMSWGVEAYGDVDESDVPFALRIRYVQSLERKASDLEKDLEHARDERDRLRFTVDQQQAADRTLISYDSRTEEGS